MAISRFWRVKEASLTFFDGVPVDGQKIESRLLKRFSRGQGVVVGDLSEYTNCGEIYWVGVVQEISEDESAVKIVWRNADFVLKPTPAGAVYWRKYDWFNFAEDVADRYLLDALFSDIFEEENWKTIPKRATLIRREKTERSSAKEEPLTQSGSLPGLPTVKVSANPTIGYVYLIWSQYGYKIGKAVNVQSRTKLFEVKLPFPIKVEHYARFDDYTQAERSLHLYFHEKRMEGEWFSLDENDVAFIKTLGVSQPVSRL